MKTYKLTSNLSLIDVAPPIRGFEKFIGVYVIQAEKIALVDVGPTASVENLLAGLSEISVNPADIGYIFVTHIHIDHAGGIGTAIKKMPQAQVIVQERGGPHLIDPARLWEDSQRALGQRALEYQKMEPVPQDQVIIAESGMLVDLGGVELEVLDTPGHATHHLSFLDRKEGRIFVGEAAGVHIGEADLIRPAAPPPFNFEQALNSLDRLIQLNPASLCYGHFGYVTQPGDKLNSAKQQLILWGKVIAECVEKEASSQEILGEIRKRDEMLARIDNLPPDKRDRELYFINNGIAGFVSYFKRYGIEYIQSLVS